MARILAPLLLTIPPAIAAGGNLPGGPLWWLAGLMMLPFLRPGPERVRVRA